MSSPIRRTNSRSSPARHTPNGFRRSQANNYQSPLRNNTDSPSRLIEEFSKVYIDDEKAFRKKLDEQYDEQERRHRQALEQSLKEHEEVRQSAEIARERLQLEVERMKLERAEQERRALEKDRRETAEAEAAARQRELEEVKQREQALQQAAAKQREVEEAQRRIEAQKKQEAEDKAKREADRAKEEADKKAKEEAAAKERAAAEAAKQAAPPVAPAVQQPAAAPKPQTNGVQTAQPAPSTSASTATVSAGTSSGILVPTGVSTPMQQREAEHKKYMDLWKLLKPMRKNTKEQAVKAGITANQLGDMRREIGKVVGQMNKIDKMANRKHMSKIKQILLQASQAQQPELMIDVTSYIVSVAPEKLQEGGSTQYPLILLYLLSHFGKSIIKQLSREVARDTLAADPLGILVVTIFAAPEFLVNGHSLIDVFWAKYHKVCPLLFGIYGSQKTPAGRRRLGWRIEDNEEVGAAEHYDNMVGYAAGFSAVTLRDFTKSKNKSPAPVHLFWTSLARILSTPNDEQTPTHYIVLLNMLKHSIPRFIGFYGTAALAALRMACVTFPSGGGPRGPSGTGSDSTVLALQSLPLAWQKDLNLTL
ncbi:hypothetical protein Q7P37_001319 [Cladosporium fusiforme]